MPDTALAAMVTEQTLEEAERGRPVRKEKNQEAVESRKPREEEGDQGCPMLLTR